MAIEQQVIDFITANFEVSPKEMADFTGASKQMVHRILAKLLALEKIEKIGRSPKVYYRLHQKKLNSPVNEKIVFAKTTINFLEKNFNLFTEKGDEFEGLNAFEIWCKRQNLPLEKTVNEFIKTRKKYLDFYTKNKLIDGTIKIKNTKAFETICLDKVYYGDFYAIERFGKTVLGNLMHFAKQSQNKILMGKICHLIQNEIIDLILSEKIEAVGFIPPTIKRELQIMTYMKNHLNFKIPTIIIKKVSGKIPIPQKALTKISDRIINAQASIVVDEKRNFKTILLIDDAIGSGATMNETACKIKLKKVALRVVGYSVVGSYKGFEVINEV